MKLPPVFESEKDDEDEDDGVALEDDGDALEDNSDVLEDVLEDDEELTVEEVRWAWRLETFIFGVRS